MKNEDKVIFAIIVIVIAVGLFKNINTGPTPESLEKIKKEISLSIDKAEKDTLKIEPIDDKIVVECECGGTGFIIHGDGHKTPCPAGDDCEAKKKITSQLVAASPEEKNGIINFYTLPGCPPCQKWKNEIKPWVEASGWKVKDFQSKDAAPWFEVWIKNKAYVFKGFMSKESFKEIVKNAK